MFFFNFCFESTSMNANIVNWNVLKIKLNEKKQLSNQNVL